MFWQKNFTSAENLNFELQTSYSLANYYLKDKNIKTFNLMILKEHWELIEKNNENIMHLYLNVNRPPYGIDGMHPHVSEYTRFSNSLIRYFRKLQYYQKNLLTKNK